MSKYCPICLGEYKEHVEVCPKDGEPTTNVRPKEFERLVDLYDASDEMEAEHIIALLRDNQLVAKYSRAGISQMPVASDDKFIICVVKENKSEAKKLIERARTDGIISHNGSFL